MSWLPIALIGPALWAISNHIDKHLIERYFKGGEVGALIIFSALIGVVICPFILFIQPDVLQIGLGNVSLTLLNGILYIGAIILYLYALQREETSVVVPLFQLIPFFLFVLGYVFLGETLTTPQIIGGLLIIAGSFAMSLSLAEEKFSLPSIKRTVLFLMALSSFMIAVSLTLFKKVAIAEDFWSTAFWGYVGTIMVGLFCLACVPSYRRSFIGAFTSNRAGIIGVNVVNEVLDVVATLTARFASLLAPLTLVRIAGGFQPVFVFGFGILLTLFFPKYGQESLLKKHLAQKAIAIVVMLLGTVLVGK